MTDVSKDSGVGVSASELGECGSLGGNDEPHLLTSAESAPDNGASILHTNDAETGNASYVRGYKTGRDAAIADVVAWLEKRGRYYQHRGDTCLDFRRIAFEDHGDVLVEIADAIERGEHNNNAVTSQEPRDTSSCTHLTSVTCENCRPLWVNPPIAKEGIKVYERPEDWAYERGFRDGFKAGREATHD